MISENRFVNHRKKRGKWGIQKGSNAKIHEVTDNCELTNSPDEKSKVREIGRIPSIAVPH